MSASNRQDLRASPTQTVALGRAIRVARAQHGLTKGQLARLLGRHHTWVGRLEDGGTVLSAFEYARIADILQIPAEVVQAIAWQGVERPQLEDEATRRAQRKSKARHGRSPEPDGGPRNG